MVINTSRAINSVSQKAAKGLKYASAAAAGYRLGRKLVGSVVDSFSKKESDMPPTRKRSSSSKTPSPRKVMLIDAPNVSPGYMRRGGKGRKSFSKSGAQYSKSSGFFKPPKRKLTPVDKMGVRGITVTREFGSSVSGNAANPFQSVVIEHATCGNLQLLEDLCYAFAKRIVASLGVTVINNTDSINNGGRSFRGNLIYRTSALAGTATQSWVYAVGATLDSMKTDLFTFLTAQILLSNSFQCEKYWIEQDGLPASQLMNLDLKRATFEFYQKSTLKIQNRTVNTADNNEADDVDNVPLFGKSYEGRGNYFIVRSQYFFPLNTIRPNVLAIGQLSTDAMPEPFKLSDVKRARVSGKAHLDPGQIKTSVLTNRFVTNINTFLKRIARSTDADNLCVYGKFRAFCLEKMIQAVGTTDVNGIKVFYESNLMSACVAKIPTLQTTTQITQLSPL